MANLFDYVKWRGDLSFSASPPADVDASILSMIVYVDFGKLCGGKRMTLRDAAENYCPDARYDKVKLGLIIPSKNINKLFCSAAKCERFGRIEVADYVEYTSVDDRCQFAAATFLTPGKLAFVIFRGTDDTLVGWQEDLCLSYMDSIPAQKMAADYLRSASERYPDKKFYVAGHSKGGNLSLYAASHVQGDVQERIARVYCFDGPGLNRADVESDGFKAVQRRVLAVVPQSSFIGIMFERGSRTVVVSCDGLGPIQHDCFAWEVSGAHFVAMPELSPRGKRNEEQFRAAMDSMSPEEKREFVETFCSVVESSGAKTLSDFTGGGIKRLAAIVKNYNGLDKEKRELMLGLAVRLFGSK